MRVAVISLILACIAGLAAFFILEKVETPQKQAELSVSQPATGLVPVAPPVVPEPAPDSTATAAMAVSVGRPVTAVTAVSPTRV